MSRFKLIGVFGLGLALGAGAMGAKNWSGTAAASAPNTSKIVLENERVRVKEAVFMPGVKPGMHTHDLAHVGVVIDGGTLKFNYPDGQTEVLELPRGGVGYRGPNVTHEAINQGNAPIRVIEVELK